MMPRTYVYGQENAMTPGNHLVDESDIRYHVGKSVRNKMGEVQMDGFILGVDHEGAYIEW